MNRRDVLRTLGSASTIGVAGCSWLEDGQKSLTKTKTSADTRTGETTETKEPAKTSEEWDINPLEHDKFVGAYYYPWYRDEYWNTYPIPATPVLGKYDSRNPDVINQHIKWSVEHGINTWIVDWNQAVIRKTWIENHFLNAELSENISFLMAPAKDPGEDSYVWDGSNSNRLNFDRPENRRQLRKEYERFDRLYFSQPNYRTIDGRPVVWEYLAGRIFKGDVAGAFQKVKESISSDIYLVADLLGTPWQANRIHRDWVEEFDAITDYSLYSSKVAHSGDFQDFLDYAERTLTEWNLMAEYAGLDFIPNVIPGYHDFRGNPVLERSPKGLRQLSQFVMKRLDQELESVFITSFNEWPEYTAVEPAKEYGKTYLKIIAEEIAQGNSHFIDIEQFHLLQFDFNKTVKPKEVEEDSTDSRNLAFMLSQIVLDEGTFSYNIGVPKSEPYFVEGAYTPGGNEKATNPFESWRWLGGPTGQSAVYLDRTPAKKFTIYGRPMIDNEIECDVYFNNQHIEHLSLGVRGGKPNDYVIFLNAN